MDNDLLALAKPVKPSYGRGEKAAVVGFQESGTAPEIVAAITAAISTYLNIPTNQFIINSLLPVPSSCNSSYWTIAGRKRLMEQRQNLGILRRRKN